MPSKLDQLRAMTVVVADTGDLDAVRRLNPRTAPRTRPSCSRRSRPRPMRDSSTRHRLGPRQGGAREAVAAAVCDRLAVAFGTELAGHRAGPGLDRGRCGPVLRHRGDVAKARAVIAAYAERGVGRERILIKIASTWEGIRAAEVLQREGIDCNLTLLFSLPQAIACAEAGAFLISPFVGRILDWHVKAGGGPYTGETDPGVVSVRRIYAYYKAHGMRTVVMGASFRNAGEIEALAGCDRLTISPASSTNSRRAGRLAAPALARRRGRCAGAVKLDEKAFRFALNEDAMATEKLAEGIRHFVKDWRSLRSIVARRMEEAKAA